MIRGYHKYKVVWYNPLVGEDLLSEHEIYRKSVRHTHCIVSCFLCRDREILTPTQKKKMVGFGHARLHNVAIKIIDGNLTVLGHIPQRMSPYFSGQNNWWKKHWWIKFHPPNLPMIFTAKVLCYMV